MRRPLTGAEQLTLRDPEGVSTESMGESTSLSGSGDVPTIVVRDGKGKELLCFLEQLIPLDGHDYALLTPVDTPVSLFRLSDDEEPELLEGLDASEPILSTAEVVLQEHELTLVRSAVTLTVSGELEEPDPEEFDEEDEENDDDVKHRCQAVEQSRYDHLQLWHGSGQLEHAQET